MAHEKILKHILALFFVLALLTFFATQWERPVNEKYEMIDRPLLGPEELQKTLEGQKQQTKQQSKQK